MFTANGVTISLAYTEGKPAMNKHTTRRNPKAIITACIVAVAAVMVGLGSAGTASAHSFSAHAVLQPADTGAGNPWG
jgi:hypothetical protein